MPAPSQNASTSKGLPEVSLGRVYCKVGFFPLVIENMDSLMIRFEWMVQTIANPTYPIDLFKELESKNQTLCVCWNLLKRSKGNLRMKHYKIASEIKIMLDHFEHHSTVKTLGSTTPHQKKADRDIIGSALCTFTDDLTLSHLTTSMEERAVTTL